MRPNDRPLLMLLFAAVASLCITTTVFALPGTHIFTPSDTHDTSVTHSPPISTYLGPGQYITKVVVAEYRTWYIDNNQVVWAYNNSSQLPVPFPIGGRKAVDGVGGFNYFRILDDQGYIWTSKIDYTTNTVRMDTDTTGGAFGGNWYVDGYGHTGLTIRADSSVWYYGVDCYSFFYPGGSLINMSGVTMKPTQLSPAGLKFKKVLFGGNGLIGLTTTGRVYKWLYGNRVPTLMNTPAPATDVFISHLDIDGCIIPDPGETSGLGYPYIWGATTSMYGGGTAFTQPTSIKALWHMTNPIREISVDWNTIHYIDSLGNMYGTGFNSFGEVGNGQEFLNKYNYPGFPGYGWDLVDYEHPSGLPVQIGVGVKWKHIFSNNWFAFYKYAQDENDSIYSWGRNKSLDLGNGLWCGYNNDEYHPNILDVLKPTMVHPLTTQFQQYGFIPPTIHVDARRVIAGTTATLTGVAAAPKIAKTTPVATNKIDTAGYHIVSYLWTKVSGAACTINTPGATVTTVTGLTTGTYIFNLLTTDNNTGTLSANDTIVVTATVPGPLVVSAGSNQTITLPTNSAILKSTASEVNGTIVSYNWSQLSGPSKATGNPALSQPTANGLVKGIYQFQVRVTDNTGHTATATVQVTVNPAPVTHPATPATPAVTTQLVATVSGLVIPGKIEAESYDTMRGVKTQPTSDVGGGLDVGWLDNEDAMDYAVTVTTAGTYTVSFRIATPNTGASLQLRQSTGATLATVNLPNTGGFQNWQTVTATTTVTLKAGKQNLRIFSTANPEWNINWMQFTASTGKTASQVTSDSVSSTAGTFVTDSTNGSTSTSADSSNGATRSGTDTSSAATGTASNTNGTSVTNGAHLPAFNIYPNPVKDRLVMEINNDNTGKMLIQLFNASGSVIKTWQLSKDQFYNQVNLSTGDLPTGIYFVRAQIGSWNQTKKLLKL